MSQGSQSTQTIAALRVREKIQYFMVKGPYLSI